MDNVSWISVCVDSFDLLGPLLFWMYIFKYMYQSYLMCFNLTCVFRCLPKLWKLLLLLLPLLLLFGEFE